MLHASTDYVPCSHKPDPGATRYTNLDNLRDNPPFGPECEMERDIWRERHRYHDSMDADRENHEPLSPERLEEMAVMQHTEG